MSKTHISLIVNDLDDLKNMIDQLTEEDFKKAQDEDNGYYHHNTKLDIELSGNYM